MKNQLYLTEADAPTFGDWFSRAYKLINHDVEVSPNTCQNITIVVTEDCNFACTYCYMHDKKQKSMTKKTAREIVDFILDDDRTNGYINSNDSPGVILDFIGGEPLLEMDVIDEFMSYFVYQAFKLNHPWKDNYVISMSSNGSLYKSEKVQKFVRKYSGRVHIGITIDGTKELHDSCRVYKDGSGTYDDVLEAVKQRFANGEHPSTKVTIAPENIQYLCEATLHLFKVGYQFLYCNVVFEDVWEQHHASMLYGQLKMLTDKILDENLYDNHLNSMFSEAIGGAIPEENNANWCGGDGSMLAIGTDGVCYPCLRYMSYAFANKDREPMVIGNIYEGIKDQDSCDHLSCLSCITRRSQSTDECFNCAISEGCAWCSAFNYDCFGTADKRTTYHCEMHKARILANVYYWNSLYRKLGLSKRYPLNISEEWALKIICKDEYNHLIKIAMED